MPVKWYRVLGFLGFRVFRVFRIFRALGFGFGGIGSRMQEPVKQMGTSAAQGHLVFTTTPTNPKPKPSCSLTLSTLALSLAASRSTHRPRSSSFLGLPYRMQNINHKKEPLRGLWLVSPKTGRTRRSFRMNYCMKARVSAHSETLGPKPLTLNP